MAETPIPLPTGFKVATDFPKARERLVNCFNVGQNRIMTRPCIAAHTEGLGRCRGQSFYRDRLFQVSEGALVIVPRGASTPVTDLGAIGGADDVILANGHTMMALVPRGGGLYKWENTGGNGTLTDISDSPNFLPSIDSAFMDGRWYYVPADGGPVFYSEVGDAGSINPLNFFDAELLPDKNIGIINVRNTLYVLGAESIELFRSGSDLNAVPRRVQGGQIQSGYIGGRIEYDVSFAYVGRNIDGEAGIFIAGSGRAIKISNDAVDDLLKNYSEAEISLVKSQRYTWHGMDTLSFTFLRDTLAFAGGEWHLQNTLTDKGDEIPWRAVFNTRAYGQYFVGDLETSNIGTLRDIDTDYGEDVIREIYTFFRTLPNSFFTVTSVNLDARAGLVPTIGVVPDVTRRENHISSQWQIATDAGFTDIVYDSQETVSDLENIQVPQTLGSATGYYWRVRYRGEASGWSDYSAATAFTTIAVGVNPPVNVLPGDGAIDVTLAAELAANAFNPIGGAQTHTNSQWQVARDLGFTDIVFDSGNDPVNLTTITVAPDLPEGTLFYWRVRYQGSASGYSDYSTPTTFTTEFVTTVATPTNLVPVDFQVDVAVPTVLTGSMFASIGQVQTHIASQWQVAEDAGFTSLLFDSGSDAINLESITVSPDLPTLADVYWRVRYEGDFSGFSNYSTPTQFQLQPRDQNLVDASAPAWLRRAAGAALLPTDAFSLSLWIEYSNTKPTMRLFSGELAPGIVEVYITGTTLKMNVINNLGQPRKTTEVTVPWVDGELYNILVASDSNTGSTRIYINDEDFPAVGGDFGGAWSASSIVQWAFLNAAAGGSGNASAWDAVGDLWFDNSYIDFDLESNRRKFISPYGDSVALGMNGETPTGSAPSVFYGSGYTATDWNTGVNLGSAGNFSTEGSTFTDVP